MNDEKWPQCYYKIDQGSKMTVNNVQSFYKKEKQDSNNCNQCYYKPGNNFYKSENKYCPQCYYKSENNLNNFK